MNEEDLAFYPPKDFERMLGRLIWYLHTTNRTSILLEELLKNTTYDCVINAYKVNRDLLEKISEELK